MWTPRRIGLLLLGILLFAIAYAVYAGLLGWLDGLPQLPSFKLPQADEGSRAPLPERPISPTELRILEAFGADCKEKSSAYPTKLEFRNGDSSVVIAAGPFPIDPGSPRITLVPFSLAMFGKPKPANLRQPGETIEISTFHSDRAILEFDRPIITPQDMSKAKLVRMELVSDSEDALEDPRRGKVHITNNQRSTDPNQKIVMLTPGPVFYRDAKVQAKPDHGPDVWTDAAVELTDRNNLPRPFGGSSPQTVIARGVELRDPTAVNDILGGRRLPPPTVTAVGMRLFLESEKDVKVGADTRKPGSNYGGLRRIELSEKVLINLWVDSHTSLVGDQGSADKSPAASGANPLDIPEPPTAASAALGGLLDAVQYSRRFDRALLQIETLGPFAYESATSTARFDVMAQANPDVPNDVQVTRVLPRGGRSELFSQVLEIEFNGAPTGTIVPSPPGRPVPSASGSGPSFKKLHAWTTTPKRLLTVSAEEEQLLAYGQDLVHDQQASRTILQGIPLYAIRDPNVLTAGSPSQPGRLVMEPGPGPEKRSSATVQGPGRIEMYDAAANARTLHAGWQTSLTNTKEMIDGKPVDLLTFTDQAYFEDTRADYWLRGTVLKLWIQGHTPTSGEKSSPGGQPRPQRIQALKDVTAHSGDTDIEEADQLNVIFQDSAPAAPALPPAAPLVVVARSPNTLAASPGPKPEAPPAKPAATVNPAAPAKPTTPDAPKPPMKLRARTIDAFVLRVPQPLPPGAKPDEGGAVKYELKTARCEDRVIAHQDPTEPNKPRGVDILGHTLDLKNSAGGGSEMTVSGTEEKPGEVHYEGMSIVGPRIFIDQVHNRASVIGRGVLQMPASSNLNGAEVKESQDVVVHWRDRMLFEGALKKAEFFGRVRASQAESWVICHTMSVGFDRPIYFNQLKKPSDPPMPGPAPAKEGPKIESVKCYPAPGDIEDDPRDAGRVLFNEVVRDETTGAVIRSQLLEARDELILNSHDRNGEAQNNVTADGPGLTRLWQPGQKDEAGGPAGAKPQAGKETETEMKLTVVKYGSRMTIEDRKAFQKVVFRDNVQVVHVPSDKSDLDLELHKLPPGAVLLTCTDTMTATSHRLGNAPPTQGMHAVGNAYIRTDEYEGWGETIDYDGRIVILYGSKTTPARIMRRFAGSDQSARVIKLDRRTNRIEMVDGVSGSITSPGK